MPKGKPEFISLKEAAQITGYSPDYIGQLIRSGKLPGKQVFSNVAWVTTKEAIFEYTQKDKKGIEKSFSDRRNELLQWFSSLDGLFILYRGLMWGLLILLSAIALSLAYVLAVSVDHSIDVHYLQKIQYDR